MSIFKYISRLCLTVVAVVVSVVGCGRGSGPTTGPGEEALPENMGALSDREKARVLLDSGVSPDSLAVFVIDCVDGLKPGISFSDFNGVETYVAERLGEDAYGAYTVCLEANLQRLPLGKKFLVKRDLPLTDMSLLGYTLGLEYVNKVIDNGLSIGKVDREVAEFHRACGADESIYRDFLDGFATGIRESAGRDVPDAVAEKYGVRSEVQI